MNWRELPRLLCEPAFASDVVRRHLYGLLRNRLKRAAPLISEDRRVLETLIFPHYARDLKIRRVLFVGCAAYTAHYQRCYFPTHDYWTLDPDPSRRRFGARQHLVGKLQKLRGFVGAGFFDLILCNGVYGWGLNLAEDCEAALSDCHVCLASAGQLMLGWNDLAPYDPAPLRSLRNLAMFAPQTFPAFGASRYLTRTAHRHTYDFYVKVARASERRPAALATASVDGDAGGVDQTPVVG